MLHNLTNKKNVHTRCFGGFTDSEEAKAFIESELGEGIISKYRNVKRSLLAHEKVQLLEQLRVVDQQIEMHTSLTNESQHRTK